MCTSRCLLAAVLVVSLSAGCRQYAPSSTDANTPTDTAPGPIGAGENDAPDVEPVQPLAQSASIVSTEVLVAGIGLGSGKDDVTAALGEPGTIEPDPQHALEFWLYPDLGLEIGISSDQRVHIINVDPPSDALTARGIGLGATEEAVRRAYGSGNVGGSYVLGEKDYQKLQVYFSFTDGKVDGFSAIWGYE